jgi:hypothetical protein
MPPQSLWPPAARGGSAVGGAPWTPREVHCGEAEEGAAAALTDPGTSVAPSGSALPTQGCPYALCPGWPEGAVDRALDLTSALGTGGGGAAGGMDTAAASTSCRAPCLQRAAQLGGRPGIAGSDGASPRGTSTAWCWRAGCTWRCNACRRSFATRAWHLGWHKGWLWPLPLAAHRRPAGAALLLVGAAVRHGGGRGPKRVCCCLAWAPSWPVGLKCIAIASRAATARWVGVSRYEATVISEPC